MKKRKRKEKNENIQPPCAGDTGAQRNGPTLSLWRWERPTESSRAQCVKGTLVFVWECVWEVAKPNQKALAISLRCEASPHSPGGGQINLRCAEGIAPPPPLQRLQKHMGVKKTRGRGEGGRRAFLAKPFCCRLSSSSAPGEVCRTKKSTAPLRSKVQNCEIQPWRQDAESRAEKTVYQTWSQKISIML